MSETIMGKNGRIALQKAVLHAAAKAVKAEGDDGIAKVAARLGVSPGTVKAWCNNATWPSYPMAVRCAPLLGVAVPS